MQCRGGVENFCPYIHYIQYLVQHMKTKCTKAGWQNTCNSPMPLYTDLYFLENDVDEDDWVVFVPSNWQI